MKETKYTSKAGKEGSRYTLEAGDVFTAAYDKFQDIENAAVVDGKPKVIHNYELGVVYNGENRKVRLTPTQKKALDALGNLKGRKFECYSYESFLLGRYIRWSA